MFLCRLLLIFFSVFAAGRGAAQNQRLTGKVSNYSAYFLEDERLRHHRYELSAKQDVDVSPSFKTVVAGRLWWDPVLMDNKYAVRANYPDSVRADELYDGQMREVYVDYLSDVFRLRIGRQIIDWTDTFAPALVNMVTAVDVRHGVSGEPVDYIIPVDAGSLSHDFIFDGTLEWLIVPRGVHHRLPKEENGYGYYNYFQEEVEPRKLILKEEEIPQNQDHIEAGIRYRASWGPVDFNLFGYRGHQRDPALKMEAGLSSVTVTQYYPRVDTYGTSLTWAGDALVVRGLAFYEPKRRPRDKEIFTYSAGSVGDDVYDRRYQVGLGLDYVFSRHLKVYSNSYFIRLDTIIPPDSTPEEKNIEGYEDSFQGVVRLTNQSIDDMTFTVDAVFTSPYRAYMIEPSLQVDLPQGYTVAAGVRQIKAQHSMSLLAPFEESDLVFVRLSTMLDAANYLTEN